MFCKRNFWIGVALALSVSVPCHAASNQSERVFTFDEESGDSLGNGNFTDSAFSPDANENAPKSAFPASYGSDDSFRLVWQAVSDPQSKSSSVGLNDAVETENPMPAEDVATMQSPVANTSAVDSSLHSNVDSASVNESGDSLPGVGSEPVEDVESVEETVPSVLSVDLRTSGDFPAADVYSYQGYDWVGESRLIFSDEPTSDSPNLIDYNNGQIIGGASDFYWEDDSGNSWTGNTAVKDFNGSSYSLVGQFDCSNGDHATTASHIVFDNANRSISGTARISSGLEAYLQGNGMVEKDGLVLRYEVNMTVADSPFFYNFKYVVRNGHVFGVVTREDEGTIATQEFSYFAPDVNLINDMDRFVRPNEWRLAPVDIKLTQPASKEDPKDTTSFEKTWATLQDKVWSMLQMLVPDVFGSEKS